MFRHMELQHIGLILAVYVNSDVFHVPPSHAEISILEFSAVMSVSLQATAKKLLTNEVT